MKFFDLPSKKINRPTEAIVDLRGIKKPISIPSSPEAKKIFSKEKGQQIIWWLMEEPPSVVFRPIITPLAGLIGLGLGIYAVFQKNWLFFILIILIFFVYFLLIFQKPPKRLFRLTQEGISIDQKFYPYHHLKGFSLVEKRDALFLALEISQFAQRYLLIPIRQEKKEKIINFLKNYLPEKAYQESFLEILADFFGF